MLDGANKEFAFHMVWTNSEVTDPAGLSGNQAGFTLPTDDNTMLSVVHEVVDRHSGCRSTWSLRQASTIRQRYGAKERRVIDHVSGKRSIAGQR